MITTKKLAHNIDGDSFDDARSHKEKESDEEETFSAPGPSTDHPKEEEVAASAVEHVVCKKYKTREYDNAVRDAVLVSIQLNLHLLLSSQCFS